MGHCRSVRLSEAEACFLDAERSRFGFLEREHGFAVVPPSWDGHGVSVIHRHPKLEVVNYLEADEVFLTTLWPLVAGRRLPVFDAENDEPFSSFEVDELVGPAQQQAHPGVAYADVRALEAEVARRGGLLRDHIDGLLTDDGTLVRQIRDRIRDTRLRALVPRWIEFVRQVRHGFDDGIAPYVAGVNLRGQIKSLLKWPSEVPPEIAQQLQVADDEFDSATVPIAYATHGGLYPHPRAVRWWRLPEDPRGRLREYFFGPR